MSTKIPVTVAVNSDDLRTWADRHADAGQHGVAHVLYKAAEGVESITEQHDREVAANVLREEVDQPAPKPTETRTEWGVRFPRGVVVRDEAECRSFLEYGSGTLVSRTVTVTPWEVQP